MRRRLAGYAIAAGAIFVGIQILQTTQSSEDTHTLSDGVPDVIEIRSTDMGDVAELTVAEPMTMRGYDRDEFGPAWYDTDRNGCDQRDDVLSRDATSAEYDPQDYCAITAISLVDPYTGKTINGASAIHIDHVVPLAAAWRGGAKAWTDEQRLQFANDLNNLWAVSGTENMAKGDKTPDEWRPNNRGVWCAYAQTYTWVSLHYRLTVTAAARSALTDMIGTC